MPLPPPAQLGRELPAGQAQVRLVLPVQILQRQGPGRLEQVQVRQVQQVQERRRRTLPAQAC